MRECKRLKQEDCEFETQLFMSLNLWLVSLAPSGTPFAGLRQVDAGCIICLFS